MRDQEQQATHEREVEQSGSGVALLSAHFRDGVSDALNGMACGCHGKSPLCTGLSKPRAREPVTRWSRVPARNVHRLRAR